MKTILYYENRIHRLTQRDPVRNAHIIAKLQRRRRQFAKENFGAFGNVENF